MKKKTINLKEIETAAVAAAMNFGAPEALFDRNYGWIRLKGPISCKERRILKNLIKKSQSVRKS